MALRQLVVQEAQKLNIAYSDDIFSMFDYVFSRLGTPDDFLISQFNKLSQGLTQSQANETIIRYLVNNILDSANIVAREAGFDFIDAYTIWFAIIYDSSFAAYLRIDIIDIPPGTPYEVGPEKIGTDKIEYPAFSGIINGYLQLVPVPPGRKRNSVRTEVKNFIYNHFRRSNIIHLNMVNVYNELLRLTSQNIRI